MMIGSVSLVTSVPPKFQVAFWPPRFVHGIAVFGKLSIPLV